MAESWYGEHAFENLMSRAEPSDKGEYFLSDLAAEFHISEAELGHFCWKHLSDADFNAYAGTLSEQGADLLRTFLGKDN